MAQISYDTLTITNIPDNLRQNFWVETTNYSSQIPAGVYITQNSASSFKNNPSGPNIFMQAANDNNGIRLRQGLLTLAEIMSDRFRLYTPNGSNQGLLGLSLDATDGLVLYKTNNATVEKGLQLSSAGLEIFGSSQSTADVTVDSNGIKLIKGGIEAGTKNTTDYIYVWSNDDSNHSITIGNSTAKTDWRIIAGNKFGVDKAGNVYATNADITGIIKANEGSIGGANGWTISSQEIKSTNYDITDSGSIYLSTKDLTTAKTINGQSRTDWRFTIGDKFGVTSDGYLHADGLNITNITAESLNIGPVVKYYVCDTAAATQAKTINNVSNFSLATGLTINVTFTYGNTSSAPTLNINDTGAVSIMAYDGTTLSNSYEYNIAAGSSRTFTYNGTNWLLQDNGAGDAYLRAYNAEDNAYGYITTISGIDGISVRRKWDSTNFVNIRDDGVHIYKTIDNNKIDVSFFGESARIGQIANGKSRVEIKNTGIDFYNRTSNTDVTLAHIGFDTGIAEGGSASTSKYPYYTFGIRDSDSSSTRGNYSFAEGAYTIAKGYSSHAEGHGTEARGAGSHAEGNATVANGYYSHAEGNATVANGYYSHAEGNGSKAGTTTTDGQYSHAEGYTTIAKGHSSHAEGYTTHAEGDYSHAEGRSTYAEGVYSHAEGQGTHAVEECSHAGGTNSYANGYDSFSHGLGTIANCPQSVVFGKYNKEDVDTGSGFISNYKYAMIIGNGTGNAASTRSNALTVDWDGNIKAGGLDCGVVLITATAGSVTSKKVTFNHTFSSPPYVVATAVSTVPGTVSEVSVGSVTTTGFTMYILRSNKASTSINWIAMYCG